MLNVKVVRVGLFRRITLSNYLKQGVHNVDNWRNLPYNRGHSHCKGPGVQVGLASSVRN